MDFVSVENISKYKYTVKYAFGAVAGGDEAILKANLICQEILQLFRINKRLNRFITALLGLVSRYFVFYPDFF